MNVHPVSPVALFYSRNNFGRLFDAEQSALCAVRIQSCDSDARFFNSPASQLAVRKYDYANDAVALDHAYGFSKWNVR